MRCRLMVSTAKTFRSATFIALRDLYVTVLASSAGLGAPSRTTATSGRAGIPTQAACNAPRISPQSRGDAIHHRDRDQVRDCPPLLPAMEAAQIVRAHDPDEVHPGAPRDQLAHRVVRISRAHLGLDAGHDDAWVVGQFLRRRDALGKRRKPARVLQGIARGDEPPHAIEAEPLHRQQARRAMRGMRRIERAAEQADFQPRRAGRQAYHGLICPVPRMRYLNVVSCSTPTGPRACMRPVAMPISAPKPNSPPSANCVDALCSTIALSTSLRNLSAACLSAVTIASV